MNNLHPPAPHWNYHPARGYLTEAEFQAMLAAPESGAKRWKKINSDRKRIMTAKKKGGSV